MVIVGLCGFLLALFMCKMSLRLVFKILILYIKSLVSIWQKSDETSESDHQCFTASFSTSSAFFHQITQEISDSTRIFRLLGSDR